MIINPSAIISHISNWITNYIVSNGIKIIIVDINNSIESFLVYKLAANATEIIGGKLKLIAVTENIQYIQLANENNIQCIYGIIRNIADINENSIVLGNIEKTYGLYNRCYNKNKELTADIFPIFDLYYSEIKDLIEFINPELLKNLNVREYSDYSLNEWAIKQENKYGIICDDKLPHQHTLWYSFAMKQKEIIAQLHQREKKTRHKINTRPYCKVRSLEKFISS